MNRIGRYSLYFVLFGVLLAGCDSAGDPEATPPPVIPAEAFALQTSLFNQGDAGKTSVGAHFAAAALRVWPVSIIISANLIIPAAVTAAALEAEPEQNGNTWTWTSTTVVEGETITFSLSGTIQGPSIRWSMRVSYTDGTESFDNFELYTATTNLNSNTGAWQLFYLIDGERRNVLNADYAVPDETHATLDFRVPNTADRNAGDSVSYEVDGDERIFDWRQVGEALNHFVTWNAVTQIGSITATNYNNGDKACWDANLDNAACSN